MNKTKAMSWGVLFIICMSAVLFLWGYITSVNIKETYDFVFSGSTVVSYVGDDTTVRIPSSYSIDGTKTVKQTKVFQTSTEANNYLTSTFTSGTDEYNGFKYQMENNAYPWTYVAYREMTNYVSGNDYTVTSIGSRCFYGNRDIKNVILSDSIRTISQEAFMNCSNLTKIELSENLVQISNGTFRNCSRLYDFTLPNKLNYLGIMVFDNCDLIQSITLPTNLSSIGRCCFENCDNLRTVYITNETRIISSSNYGTSSYNQLFYNSPIEIIYIPNSILETYQNATNSGWYYYYSCFVGV